MSPIFRMFATLLAATMAVTTTPAVDTAPTPITLHRTNVPMDQIVAELNQQQQAIEIHLNGTSEKLVTINADKQPLWSVLSDACAQAGDGFEWGYGERDKPILNVNSGNYGIFAQGGVCVATFGNIRHWEAMTQGAGARDHCEVLVDCKWEPKLNVLFTSSTATPEVATDDRGQSLIPADSGSPDQNGSSPLGNYETVDEDGNRTRSVSIRIPLSVGSSASRIVNQLKGTLHIFAGAAPQTLEIKNLKEIGKTKPSFSFVKNGSITLASLTVSDQSINCQLNSEPGPGESLDDWHRRNQLLHKFKYRIVAEDGSNWCEEGSQNGYGWGEKNMEFSVDVSRNPQCKSGPATLVLTAPSDVIDIPIAYDLKRLPLP